MPHTIHTDCLLNYETVKYFGGEAHEFARYTDALNDYQALEFRVICQLSSCHYFAFLLNGVLSVLVSLNMLNLVQNFTIVSFPRLVHRRHFFLSRP